LGACVGFGFDGGGVGSGVGSCDMLVVMLVAVAVSAVVVMLVVSVVEVGSVGARVLSSWCSSYHPFRRA
jgi:hypothetical protein